MPESELTPEQMTRYKTLAKSVEWKRELLERAYGTQSRAEMVHEHYPNKATENGIKIANRNVKAAEKALEVAKTKFAAFKRKHNIRSMPG